MTTPTTLGLTSADIQSRCGWLTLSASSRPTATQVDTWIAQYGAELTQHLEAIQPGLGGSLSAGVYPTLWAAAQGKLSARVAAEVHAANQHGDPEIARRLISEWQSWLDLLARNPAAVLGSESNHQLHTRTLYTQDGEEAGTEPNPVWRKGQML